MGTVLPSGRDDAGWGAGRDPPARDMGVVGSPEATPVALPSAASPALGDSCGVTESVSWKEFDHDLLRHGDFVSVLV